MIHLPYQPTRFVGRARELDEIAALLADPACRLLTLVGPGGIGKTRLAVEAAAHLDHFADGVYFVPLQPVNSADNVTSALAAALNLQFHAKADPDRQLLHFLSDKKLLLLLDNFEHLLDAAPMLADILQAALGVKLLITSRATLNLRNEWVRSVGGLDYPTDRSADAPDQYSAVQLFAERVRQVRGDFSLAAERGSVLRICRLVEGMPLALELAAARAKTLPCALIADEIQGSLDILTAALRDLPERHRSMQAVFDWSWRLLSEAEQTAFSRLSVFQGGFTVEAAQAVTGTPLIVLSALVERSLLRVDSTGRYQFHDLLHRFAADQLDQTPDLREQTLDAHSAYFAAFLSGREARLTGPEVKRTLDEIEAEIANIRVAWNKAISERKFGVLEQARGALIEYYDVRGWYREGANVFEAALSAVRSGKAKGSRKTLIGYLLMNYAGLEGALAKHDLALTFLTESLAIFRRENNRLAIVDALFQLAVTKYLLGDFPESYQYLEESLAIANELGDPALIDACMNRLSLVVGVLGKSSESLRLLGNARRMYERSGDLNRLAAVLVDTGAELIDVGEWEPARRHLEESLEISREIENRFENAHALELLGQVAHANGQYEAARRCFQQSIEIAREMPDSRRIGWCLLHGGFLACATGDYAAAETAFHEVIARAAADGEKWKHARAMIGLGRVAYATGNLDEAERCLQEARSRNRAIAYPLGEAHSLNWLGRVALAREKPQDAGQFFAEALRIGLDIKAQAAMLESLAGVAELKWRRGEVDEAFDLGAFCLQHPALHADTKAQINLLLDLIAPKSAIKRHIPRSSADLIAVASKVHAQLTERENASLTREPDALTEREREVLRLLIARRTNQEIADALVISVGTVKTHVHRICNKLQVSSRRDVAARAAALHLV